MDVQHHRDPRTFTALAESFYGVDPLRHTVALTALARFVTAERADEVHMATLHDDGAVIGVALRTPPWPLIGSGLPTDPDVLDVFLPRWLEHDPDLPGVTGPPENAAALADAWVRHSGGLVREVRANRLYRLEELTPPATSGAGRQATEDDVELLARWRADFGVEVHGDQHDPGDGAAAVRQLVDLGYSVVIWEDGGVPVSMAMATAPIGGMSRVAPVYTPPEYRARGYGSAVTAAVSQRARQAGARDVVLFADLANPTSNSIYQKVGYRPVYDATELEFSRLRSTT